mmetsp:Transcript_26963/g.60868  ORF Transcript_26963/g.60868 Transcript_26963/m.60868 type:complete len:118 (-) Transcript_26963:155-508(-)
METAVVDLPRHELGQFDCLVSNPPYVPSSEVASVEPEVACEDPRALEAGADGLDIVRQILVVAPTLVRPGGLVALEVHCTHPHRLPELAAPGLVFGGSREDCYGLPRFVWWWVAPDA